MKLTPFALVAGLLASPAFAAEPECRTYGATQVFDRETLCVSSVLAPQSGNRYNANSISDDDIRTAWCEGVRGNGEGEMIVIEWVNAGPLKTLWVSNGYAKSSSSFSRNGRVKDVTIAMWRQGASDSDYSTFRHRLEDHGVEQPIDIPYPQVPLDRVLIQIDSVYPGSKWQDTCINEIWTDFGM